MEIIKNLKIIDTAYGGYGVGKLDDGYTVFVPYTVENDLVDVKIILKKKRYAFAELKNIISPSNYRKQHQEVCPHFSQCGNCQFGHINYEKQIEIKKKIVKNFFRKIENFSINKTISNKNKSYRFRTTFQIKKNRIGFLKFKSNEFTEVNSCQILKQSIFEKAKSFTAQNEQEGKLYIIENEENDALLKFNNDTVSPKKFIKISHDFGYYYVGANSFSQSNRFLLGNFVKTILDKIDKKDTVMELYAGSGFFTQPISKKVEKIFAVENNEESIKLLNMLKLKNTKVINKPVEKLDFSDFNTNVLLMDPPRSGVNKIVLKKILQHGFEKIIYVSCDPSTMARDINILKEKYDILDFTLIDMFPETYHIENIAVLVQK